MNQCEPVVIKCAGTILCTSETPYVICYTISEFVKECVTLGTQVDCDTIGEFVNELVSTQ